MLNHTQRTLLDSFIAEGGIYFETIRDNEGFDLGTKILYLERAISLNSEIFFCSLDKLVNPNLNDEAQTANIELIRALKFIHDICFNHPIKYDDVGIRTALTHYFGTLGDINPGDFKKAVQEIIYARIASLREGSDTDIPAQKKARVASERNIIRQVGWRIKLDLPKDQVHCGILTDEQYQHLSREVKDLIASELVDIWELIQNYGATYTNIQKLSAQEINELLCQLSNGNLSRLVHQAKIPLSELLKLTPALRIQLLTEASKVAFLVCETGIPPAVFFALDKTLRKELITYSTRVVWFVREGGISIQNWLMLSRKLHHELIPKLFFVKRLVKEADIPLTALLSFAPDVREQLYTNSSRVVKLVEEWHIPASALLALEHEVRTQLFTKFDDVVELVEEAGISLQDLFSIDHSVCSELLAQSNHVVWIIKHAGLPFLDLIALSSSVRTELLTESFAVAQLVEQVHIPIMTLLSLDSAVRTELLKNSFAVAQLASQVNITLEQLSVLSVSQLRTIIAYPESEASKEILDSSSLGYRASMF